MTIFIVSASEANFWWTHLKNYLITGKNLTDWREAFEVGEEDGDSEAFSGYLSDFLFTPEGGVSTNNFRWADGGELVCGKPAPNISVRGNFISLCLFFLGFCGTSQIILRNIEDFQDSKIN